MIDEIGESLGFEMWNKRDKTKEYDLAGAREDDCLAGDNFVEGIESNNRGYMNNSHQSLYTLNLKTLKPTQNSKKQNIKLKKK